MNYVVMEDKKTKEFKVINLQTARTHSSWDSSREALRVARDLNRAGK